MNQGILDIDPGMVRVNQTAFAWFTKTLGNADMVIDFCNGTGHYSDNYLVAAKIQAQTGWIYYVRTKKRGK